MLLLLLLLLLCFRIRQAQIISKNWEERVVRTLNRSFHFSWWCDALTARVSLSKYHRDAMSVLLFSSSQELHGDDGCWWTVALSWLQPQVDHVLHRRMGEWKATVYRGGRGAFLPSQWWGRGFLHWNNARHKCHLGRGRGKKAPTVYGCTWNCLD